MTHPHLPVGLKIRKNLVLSVGSEQLVTLMRLRNQLGSKARGAIDCGAGPITITEGLTSTATIQNSTCHAFNCTGRYTHGKRRSSCHNAGLATSLYNKISLLSPAFNINRDFLCEYTTL